jgi:hypothetical protein
MNVYILSKKKQEWDSYIEMIVVADSEQRAREIASSTEAHGGAVWSDSKRVTCTVINPDTEGLVLAFYKYG